MLFLVRTLVNICRTRPPLLQAWDAILQAVGGWSSKISTSERCTSTTLIQVCKREYFRSVSGGKVCVLNVVLLLRIAGSVLNWRAIYVQQAMKMCKRRATVLFVDTRF